jgi:polar amino acid transport system substrate-binding protein
MVKKLLLIGLIAWCSLNASVLDKVHFITEDYPPYNYEDITGLEGFSAEILEAMLELKKSKTTLKDVEVLPWAVGYEKALNEPNVALFSTTRTPSREALFKWVGPLAPAKLILFAKKSSNITINSSEDINQYKTAVIRKDIGEMLLKEQNVNSNALLTASSNIEAAQMLQNDKVELWAYDQLVGEWLLSELGFDKHSFEPVYIIQEANYYIALNRNTSDEVVQELQEALDTLIENKTVQKILQR